MQSLLLRTKIWYHNNYQVQSAFNITKGAWGSLIKALTNCLWKVPLRDHWQTLRGIIKENINIPVSQLCCQQEFQQDDDDTWTVVQMRIGLVCNLLNVSLSSAQNNTINFFNAVIFFLISLKYVVSKNNEEYILPSSLLLICNAICHYPTFSIVWPKSVLFCLPQNVVHVPFSVYINLQRLFQ